MQPFGFADCCSCFLRRRKKVAAAKKAAADLAAADSTTASSAEQPGQVGNTYILYFVHDASLLPSSAE